MSIDIKEKIKEKRDIISNDTFSYIKEKHFLNVLEKEINNNASWISKILVSIVIDELDDLEFSLSEVREYFKDACYRCLLLSSKKKEKVIFFNNAFPGFTALLVKKTGWNISEDPKKINKKTHQEINNEEINDKRENALSDIMSAYTKRTKNKVIFIDSNDINIIFFPNDDFKTCLKELFIHDEM